MCSRGINISLTLNKVTLAASTENPTVVRYTNQEELVTKYLSLLIREPDSPVKRGLPLLIGSYSNNNFSGAQPLVHITFTPSYTMCFRKCLINLLNECLF